jgi:SAM-dependent methyltransferase
MTQPVAVLGFYSNATQQAALHKTFEQLDYEDKKLVVHPAEREGELHSLSLEIGELPIACIHAEYVYPAEYLTALARACTNATLDAIWTADRTAKPGPLGDASDPDVYQSLVPAHVFRLLLNKLDRHIPVEKRGKRTVTIHTCDTRPVQTKGALPHRLHDINGLYWLVDYAYRMDRRCIEAYLDLKKLGRETLALGHEAFLASLQPLQHRHLLFFLNSNIAGKRAMDYIAKHVDLSTVKSGLDVGSGYGGLVKAMLDRGCASATGLELLKNLDELARINLAHHDATLTIGDFLKVDLPEASFDLVTMTDVIEHVASAEEAMARTAKVLRPGGYAYIKVPNYRYIDHVREDPHTGLFGITLLRHDPAAAYLRAVKNIGYSIGDYYDYEWYGRTFAKYGVKLVRADNIQPKLEDIPKLRDACRSAFVRWNAELVVDPDIKANIRQHVNDYLREFDERSKTRRRWSWPFAAEHDELFLRDYLSGSWNLFFQKT